MTLLSTLHESIAFEGPKEKPNTVMDYNRTKCGVDVVDQMARQYSSKVASRRWPMQVCTVYKYFLLCMYSLFHFEKSFILQLFHVYANIELLIFYRSSAISLIWLVSMPMFCTKNVHDLKLVAGSLYSQLWRNYATVKLLQQMWISVEVFLTVKLDKSAAIAKLCCAKEKVIKRQINVFRVTNLYVEHVHKTRSVFAASVIPHDVFFQ